MLSIFSLVLLQGYAFNPTECVLFSLPAKYGGMGLIFPSKISQEEYEYSQNTTKESTNRVIRNEIQFQDNGLSTAKIKKQHQKRKEKAERSKTARSNK